MKKSQLILSLSALIFAAAGAFASTALVTNAAKAELAAGCTSNLTTVEDGCTLTSGANRTRCTVSTSEGIKDAFFTTTECTIGLYRQNP